MRDMRGYRHASLFTSSFTFLKVLLRGWGGGYPTSPVRGTCYLRLDAKKGCYDILWQDIHHNGQLLSTNSGAQRHVLNASFI